MVFDEELPVEVYDDSKCPEGKMAERGQTRFHLSELLLHSFFFFAVV